MSDPIKLAQEKNKLTKIQVNEVSLVDRGAIGEKFSVIKMADPEGVQKVIDDYNNDNGTDVVTKLSKMDDGQFISIMTNLLKRYNELNPKQTETQTETQTDTTNKGTVNKGGNEMDEKQITEIVQKAMGATMQTFNDNVAKLNKSLTAVQGDVEELKKAKGGKVCPKCGNNPCTCGDNDSGSNDGKGDEKVHKILGEMSSALDNMVKKFAVVDEIKKSTDSVSDRLEKLEKQENPSNQTNDDAGSTITKGAGQQTKTPLWKSFAVPQENQQ